MMHVYASSCTKDGDTSHILSCIRMCLQGSWQARAGTSGGAACLTWRHRAASAPFPDRRLLSMVTESRQARDLIG